MKKTGLKIEISLLVALIFCCVFNINTFSKQCENIREKMLRMHVIANSDTEEDQSLKLKVRDTVLTAGKEVFDGSVILPSSSTCASINVVIDKSKSVAVNLIEITD